MAQVALAWVCRSSRSRPPSSASPKMEQLTDALGAVSVALTADDVTALEASYTPRAVAGFQ